MLKLSLKIVSLFYYKIQLADLGLELKVWLLCDELHVGEFMKIVMLLLCMKCICAVLSSVQF